MEVRLDSHQIKIFRRLRISDKYLSEIQLAISLFYYPYARNAEILSKIFRLLKAQKIETARFTESMLEQEDELYVNKEEYQRCEKSEIILDFIASKIELYKNNSISELDTLKQIQQKVQNHYEEDEHYYYEYFEDNEGDVDDKAAWLSWSE